jgi:hypothetical protein
MGLFISASTVSLIGFTNILQRENTSIASVSMAMALCNSADRKRLRSMTKDCFGSQTLAIIAFKSSIGERSDRDWFEF